jgi:hypothetical protein
MITGLNRFHLIYFLSTSSRFGTSNDSVDESRVPKIHPAK